MNEDEKKELLKRTEVRTMQKDIAQLREQEAQKEKQRIANIEKNKAQEVLQEDKKPLEDLIPKASVKRPSPFEKIFIRAIIAIILFLIIGFVFWYFGPRNRQPFEEILPPEEQKEENIPEKTTIPLSLIIADQTEEIDQEQLAELLSKDWGENKLIRVVIKDFDLKDFFESFDINSPDKFLEKLDLDFTLFIHSLNKANRLGFIAKIQEQENLDEILRNWEPNMEQSFLPLFEILGKKEPALVDHFKNANGFRFQTFSLEDLGICYSLFSDYFIFTSSFNGMVRTMESREDLNIKNKVGQLFMIGFEGKEMTPQLENTIDSLRPGGVLLLSENIESEEQLKKLTSDLQKTSLKHTGLPLLIAVDQEGGPICRINFAKEKTSQSDIENIEQAYQVGLIRGQELKELGINVNLSPLLDMSQTEDFLFDRSFQKDALNIGEMAKALILGQKESVFSCIKHFPGYYQITFNPEDQLADQAIAPEFSQFQEALEAEMIMTSNMIYREIDSLPFTFSSSAIQLLKNSLNNDILIVSDDLAQNSLLDNFSLKEILTLPIKAGVDILIFSGYRSPVPEAVETLFQAVKNKEVSQSRINESLQRIIKLKEEL